MYIILCKIWFRNKLPFGGSDNPSLMIPSFNRLGLLDISELQLSDWIESDMLFSESKIQRTIAQTQHSSSKFRHKKAVTEIIGGSYQCCHYQH